jgi:hypothetical protein
MTREMKIEDRTLENVLDDDFIPENVDKWVDKLVSEINWDEDSTSDDEDVIRSFDEESSIDSIDRDYISTMTENFLNDGGIIKKSPPFRDFGVHLMFDDWRDCKTSSKGKWWSGWNVESDYESHKRKPYRLCPYNYFWKYLEETKETPHTRKEETPYIPLNA